MAETEHFIAVFIDFENLAIGFKNRKTDFNINIVLERLLEKGKIMVKKAYADWSMFSAYIRPLHFANIELIEVPKRTSSAKNSADIRMVVDAMDLSWSKDHINTFCVVSGDSDFSPLVSKLKENGKRVIGLGMKESTSDLLVENCDEFIFYEDLELPSHKPPTLEKNIPQKKKEAFRLLIEAIRALKRENKEIIWSSMVKDTIKRKKPVFSESYHGYSSFSELLEDAAKNELIKIKIDPRSGSYIILDFGNAG